MDMKSWRRKVADNTSSVSRASLGLGRQDDVNDADERKLLSINRSLSSLSYQLIRILDSPIH